MQKHMLSRLGTESLKHRNRQSSGHTAIMLARLISQTCKLKCTWKLFSSDSGSIGLSSLQTKPASLNHWLIRLVAHCNSSNQWKPLSSDLRWNLHLRLQISSSRETKIKMTFACWRSKCKSLILLLKNIDKLCQKASITYELSYLTLLEWHKLRWAQKRSSLKFQKSGTYWQSRLKTTCGISKTNRNNSNDNRTTNLNKLWQI